MNIKLLNEHNLEFLSLKEGYTGSSESIHVKMPHCWKSHVAAQIVFKSKRASVVQTRGMQVTFGTLGKFSHSTKLYACDWTTFHRFWFS